MKKYYIALLASLASLTLLIAQPCGSNGPSFCTPSGGPKSPGFGDNNNYPCIIKNEYYNYAIQFKMYEVFNYLGTQNIDSVEFVSISNLPCGICWAANRTNKRYAKNQEGCILLAGTTNDAAGQYKLGISLKAWIGGSPQPITVPASLTEQAGIKLFVRVKNDAQSNCPPLDTTSAFQGNLTASTGCPVGLNDMEEQVKSLTIFPNPVNNTAQVSFQALSGGTANIALYDLTGKVMQQNSYLVQPGFNTATISRQQMPAGAYFYSITLNGVTTNKHFLIAD